eukprot:CAMPEP_0182428360 /NCGR_PEP_ID=MMETSP1167-20130531/22610_1 /TAXON_ID=2988 /ORGANISM="Mallomonas Sp, Strain CCMP3275" /LENGTH=414 /DNA_ID=CAMNT_0024611223 /DNA_START=187 /DNA_END=1431 /DNA_ORIENTATION=+
MEFANQTSGPSSGPKLLSISILHRHGSRGPGESELGPWKADAPVRSQWGDNERENLSSTGHKQCLNLGEWFHKYTCQRGLGEAKEKVFFRSSKSGRAKESAQDFIHGFNLERTNRIDETPVPYENKENADNYFRPWKVLPGFSDTLKSRMANDQLWADKATENKELLETVFTKAGAAGVLTKLTKALWSTTYLHCIKECETFWPVSEGSRLVLTNLLSREEWDAVTNLACWVWEERFVRSGFTVSMGGKLVHEILSRSMDPLYEVNIFSGHDYTILAVLSLMGLIPRIDGPANFSCYVLFELWDSVPPEHVSGPSRKLADLSTVVPGGDGRILRVIFNSFPFDHSDNDEKLTVQDRNEKVLGEFTIPEMERIMNKAREDFHLFQTLEDHHAVEDEKDVHVLDDATNTPKRTVNA